jgi:hypothetical protein
VPTGASCAATDVQATDLYVFWSCGSNGPAGVYDLVSGSTTAMPAGQYLLGEGYVVRHEADGDLTDDRGITWTVDKHSGDVAYVDSQNAVHIVDPGVGAAAA